MSGFPRDLAVLELWELSLIRSRERRWPLGFVQPGISFNGKLGAGVPGPVSASRRPLLSLPSARRVRGMGLRAGSP